MLLLQLLQLQHIYKFVGVITHTFYGLVLYVSLLGFSSLMEILNHFEDPVYIPLNQFVESFHKSHWIEKHSTCPVSGPSCTIYPTQPTSTPYTNPQPHPLSPPRSLRHPKEKERKINFVMLKIYFDVLQEQSCLRQHEVAATSENEQIKLEPFCNGVEIPTDETNVWELDSRQLKVENKVGSGSYGDL